MGNATSNKYCPKHVAEQTLPSSKDETRLNSSTADSLNTDGSTTNTVLIKGDNSLDGTSSGGETEIKSDESKLDEILPELVCNTSTPYGCLGRRFIATIRTPSPPSIVNDSLNLLGVRPVSPPLNQVTYSSRDWILCRDFLISGIIKNYEKITVPVDYEREKSYLSNHLDTYGWVERCYQSSGLLRGEIVAPNKFIIDLFIDRPDIRQSLSTKLGPFNISDSGDAITAALTTALSIKSTDTISSSVEAKDEEPTSETIKPSSGVPLLLMEVSVISDIFINQDSINDIITHGGISKIVGDPQAYFKVTVDYLQ